jgi:ribosomal protein L44E
MKTRKAFCANCQEIKEHEVSIDNNGEFVFVCDCKRFFKLPAGLDKDGINEALARHEKANKGQISQAKIDAENKEKLANI